GAIGIERLDVVESIRGVDGAVRERKHLYFAVTPEGAEHEGERTSNRPAAHWSLLRGWTTCSRRAPRNRYPSALSMGRGLVGLSVALALRRCGVREPLRDVRR